MIRKTLHIVALRSDPIYTQLWSLLPSTQQRALLALLRDQRTGLTATAAAEHQKLPLSTLRKSIKLLERKGIIREEQTLGNTRLRLEDPFFGAWIALVIPA